MTESTALMREIETLERELTTLRTRVDQDNSSFSALEQQISELRGRLAETHDEVRLQELRLAEKKAQLAEVERLERLAAYEEEVARLAEVRSRVIDAGQSFVTELGAYDSEVLRIRQLLEEMRAAFGDDERVAAVDGALNAEREQLGPVWDAVFGATKWRLAKDDAAVEPEVKPAGKNGDDLSGDLQRRAEEGRAARILDRFSKS